MDKKYIKYINKFIIFAFLFLFININDVKADLICRYDYSYNNHSISVSLDATYATHVIFKSSKETKMIKYGETDQLKLDDDSLVNIKVDNSLKTKLSGFTNCSDSIGFIETLETSNLTVKDTCAGYADDASKCSNLQGTASTTGNTTQTSGTKTTINFTTTDNVSGVLGVNENGKYYLKINNDNNTITYDPTAEFTFNYGNKNYRIDPDTKDNIFKSSSSSVKLYALDAGTGGNNWLLSLNSSKDGYTTPADVSGRKDYKVNVNKNKNKLDSSDFKGICSEASVRKVFQIMGYVLLIAKIAVPICLIIFGVVTLVKVVISGEQEALMKAVKNLGIKALAAVIIFILPTIIYYITNLVSGNSSDTKVYGYCKTCLFEPKKC